MGSDAKIPHNEPPSHRVLIVGNYCHDVLLQNSTVVAETLGGAASFISNILSALSISYQLTSKVGRDFKYPVTYSPIVVSTSRTTVFHAYFDKGFAGNAHQDRVLKRVEACEPIRAADLPEGRFDFGMAVGVGGEILPETLEKMVDICDIVFVDIQALIRVFDRDDGKVRLVRLKESGFYHLLPRIGFLKASSEESLFMDVEEVRQWCCIVVTHGRDGCKVCWRGGEVDVAPFLANQVDPTGAGDSFLGGFVAGLVQGLSVPDAALLGNFFGSLTVGQIGLPPLDSRLLQRIKDELQRRSMESSCCSNRKDNNVLKFVKPPGHEEFYASLGAAKLTFMCSIQEAPRSPTKMDQQIQLQYREQLKSSLNPAEDGSIQSMQVKP